MMSLFSSMLSRFVIAFLLRSKHLLILWLQTPSTVIWEPKKMKSVTVSTFSPSICYEVIGPDAMIFIFIMMRFVFFFLAVFGWLFNWVLSADLFLPFFSSKELVMDREAWRAAIHGVTKSWTWLSNWTEPIYNLYFLLFVLCLCSILTWAGKMNSISQVMGFIARIPVFCKQTVLYQMAWGTCSVISAKANPLQSIGPS